MTVAIEVNRLAKSFGEGARRVDALRDASFKIRAGELVAVVGPSGAGKSTLLNLLGLLDVPTDGEYRLGGRSTRELSESERTYVRATGIGFVFQEFHLLAYRSVVANVELGLLYSGIRSSQRRHGALVALESVGLGHRLDASPATLSGGERQRVAIARAIVGEKKLVLCDEPTGNLDSVTSRQVMDLIERLSTDRAVTAIVITHDREIAERCQRQLTLRDGVVTLPNS